MRRVSAVPLQCGRHGIFARSLPAAQRSALRMMQSRSLATHAMNPKLEYEFPNVGPRKTRKRPPRPEGRINRKTLYNTIPEPEPDAHLWQIKAGVIVERVPMLFPEKESWERDMDTVRKQRAKNPRTVGRGLRLDWASLRRLANKTKEVESKGGESADTKAVKEMVDEAKEVLSYQKHKRGDEDGLEEQEVKYATSKTTPDDTNDNRKSLNRKLQTSLFLIVKKNRADHAWQFPQGAWEEGESIRATAERELREECGETLTLFSHFMGNAPIGHVKYEYPAAFRAQSSAEAKGKGKGQGEGLKGAKVYFHHALWLGGDVTLDTREVVDHLWVTKEELPEYIKSPELLALVNDILIVPVNTEEELAARQKVAGGAAGAAGAASAGASSQSASQS